jgi:hypothetical protein
MQALQERAVLPVTFGALDGEATWQTEADGPELGPHRLAAPYTWSARNRADWKPPVGRVSNSGQIRGRSDRTALAQ